MNAKLRTVAVVLGALLWASASAQQYPNKPIRFITVGGDDAIPRLVAQALSGQLGQQVFVEEHAGASGTIGAEVASRAPADGYTFLVATSAHMVTHHFFKVSYDIVRDFEPVSLLASYPFVLLAHPSLPVTTLADLIALAKAKPGQLSYGSSGSGAINHLAGELFNMMAGTRLIHVPYKGGGPAAIALLSGEITLILGEPASIVQHVKAGKLRAIAVTSARHALAMPELPTVAEAGVPGYEVTSWNGILIPAGAPADVIKRLNGELNKIISAPDMHARMIEFGYEPVGGPPEKFGEHIRVEIAKWAPVVKAAGVRVD